MREYGVTVCSEECGVTTFDAGCVVVPPRRMWCAREKRGIDDRSRAESREGGRR